MNRRAALWLAALLLAFGCSPAVEAADYGSKVSFKKGVAVTFPDLVATYLGERRVSIDKFRRGFRYHDFQVSSSAGQQVVSWSAGTGDIGPAEFRVGRARYQLELSQSDRLGRLKPDEMVISKMP